MRRISVLSAVNELGTPVFTTHDVSLMSGRSLSVTTQTLNYLAEQGAVSKLYRGIWAREGAGSISAYILVPYLFPKHRAYVSFISAFHLHGMIEQIPQVTTLASTAHARVMRTKLGVFHVHRITPRLFDGFDWYKGEGSFLIAGPEKALVDSLYLSTYKKKRFGNFPELHLPPQFSFKKVNEWVRKIPSKPAREHVKNRLDKILG